MPCESSRRISSSPGYTPWYPMASSTARLRWWGLMQINIVMDDMLNMPLRMVKLTRYWPFVLHTLCRLTPNAFSEAVMRQDAIQLHLLMCADLAEGGS